MTIYARLTQDLQKLDRLVDLTPEQHAALVINGKAAFLRLYVPTPQPDPVAGKVFSPGPPAINATNYTLTWTVRDMTATELANANLQATLTAGQQALAQTALNMLNTQIAIDATAWAALTAAQKMDTLFQDRQVVLRVVRYLLRQNLQQ